MQNLKTKDNVANKPSNNKVNSEISTELKHYTLLINMLI
jgi:hypothetical protein